MRKTLTSLLICLSILTVCVSCSPDLKTVTLHVPDGSLAKASSWQNEKMYILQATGDIAFENEGNYVTGFVHSNLKKSEVTVTYHEGDTIYDVLNNRIFVYEPDRIDDPEYIDFVPLFVYMTRYGIGNLPMSTTGFNKNVFYDWNLPLNSTDLYICFSEIKD